MLKLINKIPYIRNKLKEYVFLSVLSHNLSEKRKFTLENFDGDLDLEEEIIYKKFQRFIKR